MSTGTEPGCFAVTLERKYFRRGNAFIKRSLRPREFCTGYKGLHVPRSGNERLKNEGDCMRYVQQPTDVPVPKLYCDFEDDGAYYLIMEYVQGVGMNELSQEQKVVVKTELQHHLNTLHSLKYDRIGGPGGLVIPPYRVTLHTDNDTWTPVPSQDEELVFCHNDLSQPNVVVDSESLKINAILDWEYAGFYPAFFECAFYERLGSSAAVKGESDDSRKLLEYMLEKQAVPTGVDVDGRAEAGT
ncbi:Transcription factor RAX1 [Elsinoe australis]|uniref:Transcription factor RAX1 n=1 Tax=Elsinoe australis TaxID=40998 RepID=A0A2P8A5M6_9PEZI|nr:Transcription factor RAX1 [Elsinoe australis]